MNWDRYARAYRIAIDRHRTVFGLFIVTTGTFTVMLLQGLIAGKLYVPLLFLYVIPAYCLYIMWRGVRESENGEATT